MASHGNTHSKALADEKIQLGQAASGIKFGALGLGLICLAVAAVMSFFMDGGEPTLSHARFYHGYLVGIAWSMSICLGGLFFILIHSLIKAGWSVNVLRVPQALAATLPYIGILTIPLFIPVLGHKGGELYPWAVAHVESAEHGEATKEGEHAQAAALPQAFADAEPAAAGHVAAEHAATGAPHKASSGSDQVIGLQPSATPEEIAAEKAAGSGINHAGTDPLISPHAPGEQATAAYTEFDELTEAKAKWLNAPFFIVRVIAYFAVWTLIGWYFYSKSKKQDVNGDIETSQHLSLVAPISIIAFALTATFAAFDLIMSLDHHWFSTIFGVYVFAGGMIGMFATSIITYRFLQSKGLLLGSVSTEHFHDLGKYLFAFTFFWGYVGFSQFMLQWYANIPEETQWWLRRGVTSADTIMNNQGADSHFAGLSLVLLFGHFLLPFPYLISRHIKRSKEALLFGAAWMLLAHLVDMYWLIMPEYNNGQWALTLPIVAAIVGVISMFVFAFLHTLGGANLRPIGEPRADESLAFVNM